MLPVPGFIPRSLSFLYTLSSCELLPILAAVITFFFPPFNPLSSHVNSPVILILAAPLHQLYHLRILYCSPLGTSNMILFQTPFKGMLSFDMVVP